ncbi:MAG: SIS domain-containing protein [Candidatus Izemoplasma sp.]
MTNSLSIAQAQLCIERSIEAIANMHKIIWEAPFFNLVRSLHYCLERGNKIVITGVGKNGNIAAKASETFVSLGLPSFYLNASNYFHGDAGFIGEDDFVIALSKSGTTAEIQGIFTHRELIKNKVENSILIHCNPEFENDIIPNLCLGEVTEGDANLLAPTASTALILCFLDCISVTLSDMRGFTQEDFLKYHPGGTLSDIVKKRINE